MSLQLITQDKKFRSLFWTQFFGALNDNLLKNSLVVLVTFKGIAIGGFDSQALVALSGALFILPFFLFSPLSGQWADGFERAKIIRLVKIMEVVIMAIAAIGYLTHSYGLLFFTLFLMGLHSTLFGPVKYSLIPDLVSESQVVSGNAMIEVGTFLAILIGTIGGGILISLPGGEIFIVAALLIAALIGLITGFQVPMTGVAQKNLKMSYNPFPEILKNVKEIMPQKAVWNSILGISWFWFFGAALLTLIPVYAKDVLGSGESVVTLFLAVFTIGIAIGSVICEKLSFERVEIGLVPLGSLGMTIALVDLARASSQLDMNLSTNLRTVTEFFATQGSIGILVDLFLVAIFGGLFTVPLYSLIQTRSQATHRSRVIAANNILNSLFMVTSAILIMIFHALKWGPLQMFLVFALLNLIVAIYIYSIVPEFTLRFIAWILSHCLYRIKATGLNNIPKEGPALIVCNHVSFIDWLLISAMVKRPIRFVMYYKFYKGFLTRYFFQQAKVIPIAGKTEDPQIFQAAFEKISKELRAGELVCVFPEGKLTADGKISEFKAGYQHILAKDQVPIVPMALNNLWGSMFSRYSKETLLRLPRKLWKQVDLVVGEAIANTVPSPAELQQKVAIIRTTP